jgi:hypothetical protein
MARALMRVVLVVVVLIGSALLPRSGAVSADNSRDAARVLVCTWSYHGVDQREEIADLDRTVTQSEKDSLVRLVQMHAVTAAAGEYFHEYPDYPNWPKTVQVSDLKAFKCKWTEGPVPQDP